MMASRSRFVACALFLVLLTQALARPEQLDGERKQAAETTETKVVERQRESAAQFFPSASPSPSPTPTIQCGCRDPGIRIYGGGELITIPGYYTCSLSIPIVGPLTGYCPISPGDVPCTCPFGFVNAGIYNDAIKDDTIWCSPLLLISYDKWGIYQLPCDDDDDDDFDSPFFPSPSASVPSFFQEAPRDLSDPVEELKTGDLHLKDILDLDLDSSGSTKSRDSRVQALTNQSLDKLMEALKE